MLQLPPWLSHSSPENEATGSDRLLFVLQLPPWLSHSSPENEATGSDRLLFVLQLPPWLSHSSPENEATGSDKLQKFTKVNRYQKKLYTLKLGETMKINLITYSKIAHKFGM